MQCSCHSSRNTQVQAPNDLTSKVQSNSEKKLDSIVSIMRERSKKTNLVNSGQINITRSVRFL